jgi:GTP-binding protein
VGDLYPSIHRAYESARKTLTTNILTQILQDAVTDHAPPIINGRRIKLRYAHAGGQNPPIIVIHGKQTDKVPGNYTRYLEKTFRKVLKLEGTPVKIELRSGENPFIKSEENLNPQQIARKRRMTKNKVQSKKNAATGRAAAVNKTNERKAPVQRRRPR